jgi:hypothetical protein
MASVDIIRVNPARDAKPTAAVDFPTPVAPAMTNNRGGRVTSAFAVACAKPTLRVMRCTCRDEHMRLLPFTEVFWTH